MTEYTMISLERSDAVATITLRRPRKLNALTDGTNIEIARALDELAADTAIRVVVLTGEGRAFCCGYDVSEGEDMPERTPAYWVHHFGLAYATLRKIWGLPQPVVAKVRGACLGGGLALAMACDLAYAAEDAFFGDSEIKFGGGGNIFPALQWALGIRLVSELMLTGRSMRAPEAAQRGLINEIVASDELDTRVDQVVRHMCLLPSDTLARNKAAAHRVYETMGLGPLLQMAQDNSILGLATRAPSEFVEIAREQGVTAALRWQKARFSSVSAFE